jgi:SOS response regulatory protein OraA/RecX
MASLKQGTTYTVTLPAASFKDKASNKMASNYVYTFTTSAAPTYRLTANRIGTGTGFLTVTPPGIGIIIYPYTNDYTSGTVVSLDATTDEGSTFSGWSGDCTGPGVCRVTMTSAKTVSASFTKIPGPAVDYTLPANNNVGWPSEPEYIAIIFTKDMSQTADFRDITISPPPVVPVTAYDTWWPIPNVLAGSPRLYADTKYTFTLPKDKFKDLASNTLANNYVFSLTMGGCDVDADCDPTKLCRSNHCVGPDTTAPITDKQYIVTGTSVYLEGVAQDPESGVKNITLYWDSSEYSCTTAPVSKCTTTVTLAEGTHSFYVEAYNNIGLSKKLPPETFTVGTKDIGGPCTSTPDCLAGLTCVEHKCTDEAAPKFESVVLSPETIYAGQQVAITASVSDNYALRYIDFYIDNQAMWDDCSLAQHETPPEPNIYGQKTGTCTNTMVPYTAGQPYDPANAITLNARSHTYRLVLSDMQPNYEFYPGPDGTKVNTFTVLEPPQIGLTVEPASQKSEAGDTVYYAAKITNNRADGVEHSIYLNISCPSCGTGWQISPNSTMKTVGYGKTSEISFSVKSPSTIAKTYPIIVNASDAGELRYNATTSVNNVIGLCGRVAPDVSIKPSKVKKAAGDSANFTITVTNKDECTGYFNYSIGCPDDWDCELSKTQSGAIAVGAKSTVVLDIESAADAEADAYILEFAAVNSKKTSAISLKNITFTIANCTDLDGDGYYRDCDPEDCDDTNPAINPDADELCYDQIDNNCNGKIDSTSEGCTGPGSNPADASRDNAPPYDTTTPDCGNNIVETGEDCDGTTDSQCPGLCTFDCICPFIVGDSVCESDLGESSAISADCKKKLGSTGLAIIVVGILGALAASTFYFWRRKGKFGGLAVAHGVETATPGVDLDTAVNSMLSEGYNPEEIHSNLEAGGWSHNKIDTAMESAQTDQEALGRMAEQQGVAAPTEKAKASRYVKKCLEQGYDPTQIRTTLLSSGWPANTVDGAISTQTAKHLQAHAEKAGVTEPSSAHKEDLADYIKKELSEGHTKQSIKKVLKDTGWPSLDVNKAFKE